MGVSRGGLIRGIGVYLCRCHGDKSYEGGKVRRGREGCCCGFVFIVVEVEKEDYRGLQRTNINGPSGPY